LFTQTVIRDLYYERAKHILLLIILWSVLVFCFVLFCFILFYFFILSVFPVFTETVHCWPITYNLWLKNLFSKLVSGGMFFFNFFALLIFCLVFSFLSFPMELNDVSLFYSLWLLVQYISTLVFQIFVVICFCFVFKAFQNWVIFVFLFCFYWN